MTIVAPEWAADLIGIPFEDRGRTPAGADCWGVFRLLLLKPRFGVELPLIDEGYAGTERADGPQCAALIQEELARGVWNPIWEAPAWQRLQGRTAPEGYPEVPPRDIEREGDGILLRFNGYPMHVAGVLRPGLGLSSVTGIGSYLLRYREILTKDTVLGFYRHADLLGRL